MHFTILPIPLTISNLSASNKNILGAGTMLETNKSLKKPKIIIIISSIYTNLVLNSNKLAVVVRKLTNQKNKFQLFLLYNSLAYL